MADSVFDITDPNKTAVDAQQSFEDLLKSVQGGQSPVSDTTVTENISDAAPEVPAETTEETPELTPQEAAQQRTNEYLVDENVFGGTTDVPSAVATPEEVADPAPVAKSEAPKAAPKKAAPKAAKSEAPKAAPKAVSEAPKSEAPKAAPVASEAPKAAPVASEAPKSEAPKTRKRAKRTTKKTPVSTTEISLTVAIPASVEKLLEADDISVIQDAARQFVQDQIVAASQEKLAELQNSLNDIFA